VGNINR